MIAFLSLWRRGVFLDFKHSIQKHIEIGTKVCSEENVSQTNANIFVCILKTFSRISHYFWKKMEHFRERMKCEKMPKFYRNFFSWNDF